MAPERVAQRADMALHGRAECARLLAHDVVDGERRAHQRLVEAARLAPEAVGQLPHVGLDGGGEPARLLVHHRIDGQRRAQQRIVHVVSLAYQGLRQVVDLRLHGRGERLRLGAERGVEGMGRALHGIIDQRQPLREGGIERARALHELGIEGLGAGRERGIERHRVVVEHGLQLLRAVGEVRLEAAAGGGELVLERDQVLPRPFDDLGELDLLLGEVLDQPRHLAAHLLQGLRDLVGGAHQGLALADEFLDQTFDLVLVLAVGALEGRDLVVDQGLELAGAAERARDGLVHERDLAPHGLAQRGRGLLGGAIGLGEAHGNLGHGRGHELQFLGAPGEQGQEPEQRDRQGDGRRRHHGHRAGEQRSAGGDGFGSQQGPDQQGADGEPASGRGRGQLEGAVRRALLQRENQPADRRRVIVGRHLGAGRARRPPLGLSPSARLLVAGGGTRPAAVLFAGVARRRSRAGIGGPVTRLVGAEAGSGRGQRDLAGARGKRQLGRNAPQVGRPVQRRGRRHVSGLALRLSVLSHSPSQFRRP